MPPTHFSSILLSNWQSAVARIARRPTFDASGMTRPPLAFDAPKILAAAAAADGGASGGGPVGVDGKVVAAARAALDYARTLVSVDKDRLEEVAERFSKFGADDPFWGECIAEFVEHYSVTKHSEVPYIEWRTLSDFVLPQSALPSSCTIAVIGDWGTGEVRAQRLLEDVAKRAPDILLHLGDIYYACTSSEANTFYDNVTKAFPGKRPRLLTLCGNHDMYSGAAPYYTLLNRIEQPASYFCLRNRYWQLLGADTGYNDFDPFDEGAVATWIRDLDEGESFSELAWHRDKFVNAGSRRTVLFTHHQLFTRNSSITAAGASPSKQAVNERLYAQFSDFLPDIALWLWGHEHNQLIYAPFRGLECGRCLGASAIPVPADTDLTSRDTALTGQDVPELLATSTGSASLQPERSGGLYQLGYAVLTLSGPDLQAEYFQFDGTTNQSTSMHVESIHAG